MRSSPDEGKADAKVVPGTLSRNFVDEVRKNAIEIAKTTNPNVREQLAKAFSYFFEKILPLDKKEKGLLTREGNIDLNEVAALIKLFQDNKEDDLKSYLQRNPNYKTIISLLRSVKNIEDFERYLSVEVQTSSDSCPFCSHGFTVSLS